jgi:hypothetical protein
MRLKAVAKLSIDGVVVLEFPRVLLGDLVKTGHPSPSCYGLSRQLSPFLPEGKLPYWAIGTTCADQLTHVNQLVQDG